ncbi:MAG: hypothetical protein U5R06_12425 [candidate division KSB1 bacterium]|nr:hypothetical protein [candidate division KSB1 bacterium]
MKRAETAKSLSLPDWLDTLLDPVTEMQNLVSELSKKFNEKNYSYEHFMSYVHMNHANTASMLNELWSRIDTDIQNKYLQDSIVRSNLINWHHDLKTYRALMLSLLNEYEAEHKQDYNQEQPLVEAA